MLNLLDVTKWCVEKLGERLFESREQSERQFPGMVVSHALKIIRLLRDIDDQFSVLNLEPRQLALSNGYEPRISLLHLKSGKSS